MPNTPPEGSNLSDQEKKQKAAMAFANAERFFDSGEGDMEQEGPEGGGLPDGLVQRTLYGAIRCLGVGLLAGALESFVWAISLKLPLGFGAFFGLALIAAVIMAVVGAAVGVGVGVVVHGLLRRVQPVKALAVHLATVGALLFAYYFWPFSAQLFEENRLGAGVFLGTLPIFLWGVVFLNALPWLRKVDRGRSVPAPWLVVAPGLAVVVALGSSGVFASRNTHGVGGLESDPNVLIVSIDTLRRDHVGVFGGQEAPPTPHLDALAREGAVFLDAITPLPETAPAHASMMTGLHPLRHRMMSNRHTLSRRIETLARVLDREGYSTAAFVSSIALDAKRGLSEGFSIYDDDLGSPIPGLARMSVVSDLLSLWMRFGDPAATPSMLERDGAETNAHFERWLDAHQDGPFFGFIHYFEPHAPYESHGLPGFEDNGPQGSPSVSHRQRMSEGLHAQWSESDVEKLRRLYAEEVTRADALVGEVMAMLDARGLAEDTLVVVLADHGEMLGEHGLNFHHRGLYDPVIRTPMLMRFPEKKWAGTEISSPVRIYDLYATILEFTDIEAKTQHESMSLMGYLTGKQKAALWCPLVGRSGQSDSMLIGLRHKGLKYIRDVESGAEWLYDLDDDPAETKNIASESSQTLDQARRAVAPDVRFLEENEGVNAAEPGAATDAMLKALGYQ